MTLEAIVFFVAAALALAGAVGVVLGRNPVHCALMLVVTLVAVAVFFLLQEAQLDEREQAIEEQITEDELSESAEEEVEEREAPSEEPSEVPT